MKGEKGRGRRGVVNGIWMPGFFNLEFETFYVYR